MKIICVTCDYDKIPITTIVINDDQEEEAVEKIIATTNGEDWFNVEVGRADTLEEGLAAIREAMSEQGEE